MKKKNALNGRFKLFIPVVLLLLLRLSLSAQNEQKRTIEKVFDGKTALWAAHRYGDLILKKGSGSQIKAVLTVSASGKDEAEIQQFLNHFNLSASDGPDNKADLKTDAMIKNWKSVNGRTTIKFNDGTSFSGIRDFKMTLEITAPKLRYATLENKYANIRAEDGTATDLEIKLYDGAIDLAGTFENLKIDTKYSKGTIGNFNQCQGELYDSDLNFGNGNTLKLTSKYSGVKAGNYQTLQLDCYDDDYSFGAVSGQTTIQDKYSEFKFTGNLGNLSLRLYDSKIETKNAVDIEVGDSKYTEYSFGEINSLRFGASYNDVVRIEKTGALGAQSSKYTNYVVDGLWKSLNFPDSYNDVVQVRSVGATFSDLVLYGKYTQLNFPIPAALKYEINAELQYCRLVYAESAMESLSYKEKNEAISLKARSKDTGSTLAKVDIRSYDGKVVLK